MKSSQLIVLALASASAVLAAPTPSDSDPTETQVLQFALTLEYLENAFYSGGLEKYDAQAFEDAGFPAWVRGRFEQIMDHEKTHVSFLQNILGSSSPQPCNYSFPDTDARSFVELSMGIEGVGAAAYLGASQYLTDKATLTAGASILSVEQRQVGWVSSATLKHQPWDGAFETPLGPSAVYSLASPYITSCPSSNPPLPVTSFPALTVSPASPWPGATLSYSFTPAQSDSSWPALYAAFFSGLEVVFENVDMDSKTVTVPSGMQGTVYLGLVSSNQTPLTDSDMVTGLTILQMPFDSMETGDDNQ